MTSALVGVVRDINYSAAAGDRGFGDLFLTAGQRGKPPVLLIHGGGWNGMSKEAFEPVASAFIEFRRAVFSINYRLLDQAPWPACGDDCLAAAKFVLGGGLAAHGLPAPARILICGGSAGGHLAMMTGLRLPPERVEAIISLAGPCRMDKLENEFAPGLNSDDFLLRFFGTEKSPSADMIASASPTHCVRAGAPPLFCIHSQNDRLVYPGHSEEAVSAWREAGAAAELFLFDGSGRTHGLFDSDDLATRNVDVSANALIREVLHRFD